MTHADAVQIGRWFAGDFAESDSRSTTTVWATRGTYLWLMHPHPSSLRALDKMNFIPAIDSHSLVIGRAVTAMAWIIGIVCLLGVFA